RDPSGSWRPRATPPCGTRSAPWRPRPRPWTALCPRSRPSISTRSASTTSPDYVRADTVWNQIAIRALSFRSDQDRWSDQRAYVVSAMKLITREAGPYVWPSFTSAEAYVGGGAMEYPMLIMNDPDMNTRWFEWLDVTIAHELAHNWFYGMLGSDERAFPWLDEGFAQYMEHRYGDWKHP